MRTTANTMAELEQRVIDAEFALTVARANLRDALEDYAADEREFCATIKGQPPARYLT